jgi:hypothetical protein
MEKNKIFISHRHSDTQSDCHRLKSDLQKIFGKDQVFLDIENLEPGIKFAEAIEKTLAQSKVVLVVIGPDWVHVTNDKGGKRLFDEKDWVRREIAASLNDANTRVIPVLVKGASIPEEEDLPEDLKPLTQLQVAEITTKRWDYDLGELTKVLEKLVPKKPEPRPEPKPFVPRPPQPKSWWAKNYLWVLGGIVVFFILINLINPPYDVNETSEDENISYDSTGVDLKDREQYTDTGGDDPNQGNLPVYEEDLRTTKPDGQEIYESLTFAESVPDFSGKWWLRENGLRMGYFIISQEGTDFTFDYYYFDQLSGRGYGSYVASDKAIYSEEFALNDTRNPAQFAFVTTDNGSTWTGLVQKYAIENNATLSKEY